MDERTDLAAENAALRAALARLEEWQNMSTSDWCRMHYEDDLLIHRVISECEASRRGVAVTYAVGDDPVSLLKRRMPTVEQIEACERARAAHSAHE